MRFDRTLGIIGLSLAAAGIAYDISPLTINPTHSAPVGLYVESHFDQSLIRRGSLVLVCPPDKPVVRLMRDRGYLPLGDCAETQVMPLGKRIYAVAGDTVLIKAGSHAAVNGTPIPNTIARKSIPAMPDSEYIVKPGEAWVFSSYNGSSFDSRYFGAVQLTAIRSEVSPLLVSGNVEDI